MSSEEEKESLICPYCNRELVDDENQLNECSHLYSVQDDFVDWGDDYNFIIEINQIIENYVFDVSENELKDFTKGLKIDKYLSVNDDWDDFTIEESIESLTDDIFIIREGWDANRPGGSGTFKFLFINDKEKVKWVFDELKILHERLLQYDKDNDGSFITD